MATPTLPTSRPEASGGDPLEPLRRADPELAAAVAGRLAAKPFAPRAEEVARLAAEALAALAVEPAFGRALALGWGELLGEAPASRLEAYGEAARRAGAVGPTRGRIIAERLPAVLKHGREGLPEEVLQLCDRMDAAAGLFLLDASLAALGRLLAEGDHDAAAAFLGLLRRLLALRPGYAATRFFAAALPRAARELPAGRRGFQLAALERLVAADPGLAEPFLEGLDRGLGYLDSAALDAFLDAALARPGQAARWLSLETTLARERLAALQVRVGFAQVQDLLQRYLRARTGLPLRVRPFSELSRAVARELAPDTAVTSDAEAIYLPEEIDWGASREENVRWYKLLLRLEASFHEFGTLAFDLERLRERVPDAPAADPPEGGVASDLERFLQGFDDPALAGDLFTVFELGRLRRCLERRYPGLVRAHYPLGGGAGPPSAAAGGPPLLAALLARIALAGGGPAPEEGGASAAVRRTALELFAREVSADSPVEAAAGCVVRLYPLAAAALPRAAPEGARVGLSTPFGWRPWPSPAAAALGRYDRQAEAIRAALDRRGLHAYRGDIRRELAAHGGRVDVALLRRVCRPPELSAADLAALLPEGAAPGGGADAETDGAPAFRYPEWSRPLGDYLVDHVLVRERAVAPAPGLYEAVLARHAGLVRQTRRAFERLKPEGVKRLRGRPDGDELDYPRLVEFAVARRAGGASAERLYLKRLAERRDVAVLLLVDLSRSTANRVPGSNQSVLEVEREAIVILCEAIAVLGDRLAVAGFSGTGRLGVDYYRIKGFDEPLSAEVRGRIGGLAPQRNTRMGAAIRHAGRQIEREAAALRLLILLGDGFPNDRDYKQEYALEDTRRAILELLARRIRVHALTVNLPADPNLDALYGRVRHQVISDVRELPERLVRAYGALTRR